jgi:hypothetical protein
MEPPGQTTLNQFELAILSRMGEAVPALQRLIPKLHVLSREFTGVGSYTKLLAQGSAPELGSKPISLKSVITVPGIKHGMDAVLFCKDGKPETLEIVTFGNEMWDGTYEGFSISKAT